MSVVPIYSFNAFASPIRLQGVISLVLLWEGRRTGIQGIFVHHVLSNPSLSQVDWVDGPTYSSSMKVLEHLPEYTISLSYREAFHLFTDILDTLEQYECPVEQSVIDFFERRERPKPLSKEEWLNLMFRMFERPLNPRELVHAYFQAWAIEDWTLIYILHSGRVQGRYTDHNAFGKRMNARKRNENILRGSVVAEELGPRGVWLESQALIGKSHFMVRQRIRFHVIEEDGRWVISSIRGGKPERVPLSDEPFFQGSWYWRVFPTKNAERILEILGQMEGANVEYGEKGTAIIYLSHVTDSLEKGFDISRDARGQVWINRKEMVVGAVDEERLQIMLAELRRQKIIGKTMGRGPFRLPEVANYVYREGSLTDFDELVQLWGVPDGFPGSDGVMGGTQFYPGSRTLPELSRLGSLFTQFVRWRFDAQWKREWRSFAKMTSQPRLPFEEHPYAAFFWEWFTFERVLREGATLLEIFTQEVTSHLPTELKKALESWNHHKLDFYYISGFEQEAIRVVSLGSGKEYRIVDPECKPGEPPFREGMLLFCRLIPWEGAFRYGGIAHFFPPWYAPLVQEFLRQANPQQDQWPDTDWQGIWRKKAGSLLAFLLRLKEKPIPPLLLTAEGHKVISSRALYQVNDIKSFEESIGALPELVPEKKKFPGQGDLLGYSWLEQGFTRQLLSSKNNKKSGVAPGIISDPKLIEALGIMVEDEAVKLPNGKKIRQVGTLFLHQQQVIIDTISPERLDVLKRVLLKYCGFFLTHEEDIYEEVPTSNYETSHA